MKFNEFSQQQFADDLNLFEQFIDDQDVKKDLDFDENKEVHFLLEKTTRTIG